MDILIPYITSRWNDTELKYCLRSIEKYLTGYGNIYLLGDCPIWVKNIIHIPMGQSDKSYYKEKSVYDKLMWMCERDLCSDHFLYMNDDHFLLQQYSAPLFPNYYSEWPEGRTDLYGQTIQQTRAVVDTQMFFDIHCPMVMEKSMFISSTKVDWEVKAGYCMKTLYAQWAELVEYCVDLKCNTDTDLLKIAGRKWFSLGETCRSMATLQMLNNFYPDKSKYEK